MQILGRQPPSTVPVGEIDAVRTRGQDEPARAYQDVALSLSEALGAVVGALGPPDG